MQFQKPGLAPLNHKEFRLFIFCRFFYIMALRMVATVVAYQLFQITKDSFSIGIVGLSEFIPVVTLALYAGHVIDRSDKRTLLLKGILANAVCVLALVLVTIPSIQNKIGIENTPVLFYVIIFFTGIVRAFAGPTSHAIIAQLVPRNILQYAASISSSSWLAASILGHASAGFLIAGFGINLTFVVILVLVLTAAAFLSQIDKKPVIQNNTSMGAWESVKEGLRFVFTHKILLGAISLDLFAVLFGGAVALIPEFAHEILKVGPIGFGWLNAAIDIGSIITIILITIFPLTKKQGYKLFWAVAGFGLCIIIFGLSQVYWISFAALLIAGILGGLGKHQE